MDEFDGTEKIVEGCDLFPGCEYEKHAKTPDVIDLRYREKCNDVIVKIPKNYDASVIDGEVVIRPCVKKYPKDEEECYLIAGNWPSYDVSSYRPALMHRFQKLLILRDAYRKIAGEEMRMGKPWKPDWSDNSVKYCIYCNQGVVTVGKSLHVHWVMSFPDEACCQAFADNFEDLIKEMEEFL